MTISGSCHDVECLQERNTGGDSRAKNTVFPTETPSTPEGLSKQLVKDVHAQLRAALRGASLWDSLDYFEISTAMQKRENAPFPTFQWLSCAPVTSGGHHYIYIGTVCRGRHNLVFVGKTSKGFQAACAVANRCAHELGA